MRLRHHPLRLTTLLALLTLAASTANGQTLIEKSLERLEKSPPSSPECFDFIVVADSNTLEPLEQSEVFRQCLREFNILAPGFIVEVGDIILGGAAEGVPAQWDLFDQVIASCQPPYLPLPGNHDISDEATERIWLDRIGPTHYAFHYGNSCFILMNSEEVDAVGRISDEQVAWLKQQLASTRATNIFLFLHQPHFQHEKDPGTADEYLDAHWANVNDALHGHPVKAVFSGHRHRYLDCGIRDGIHYAITGGASVYGKDGTEEEGYFNHYLLVRVRGSEVSWAVIKPGAILPEDTVTSARTDELYNIRNKWVAAEELQVPLGAPIAQDLQITISNPGGAPMKSALTWHTKPGWAITPAETAYQIPPNSSLDLSFHVHVESPEAARFPVPFFETSFTQVQHGPPVDVQQDLKLIPTIAAQRVQEPIKLDGVLDEWTSAQMAPLTYPRHYDGKDPSDLTSHLGFLWNDEWLYLAVETIDNEFHQPYAGDIVWSADNVEMFLDDWSWGLSLTKDGPEVFLYWGVDVSAETVNTDVKLAVKRDGDKITYEAAFPASHLTPLNLSEGNSFRFNALMNDLDPAGPEEGRHWLQLVPEAGAPGSQPPRVKVVLQ